MIKKTTYKLILILLVITILILAGIKAFHHNDYNPNLKIPILAYHHIANDLKDEGTTVTPQKFYEDMLYLKDIGYETISFKNLVDYKNGDAKIPTKPIIITFDDGYESNYTYAYPILKKLNLKATISIIGWSVGQNKYPETGKPIIPHFTWAQAKEMYDSGLVDIQYHSYDLHNDGDGTEIRKGGVIKKGENIDDYKQVLANDFNKLKNLIKLNIGNEVFVYTYPYGVFDSTSESIIKEMGCKVSLSTQNGVNKISDGLFAMKRINVSNKVSSSELFNEIQKMLDQQNVPQT